MFIGIDLGTSNCSAAICRDGSAAPESCAIQQQLSREVEGTQTTLPSVIFLGTAQSESELTGEYARELGTLSPDRLIHSAKSWLSVRTISPSEPFLPFQSEATEVRKSPVEVSAAILEQIHSQVKKKIGASDESISATITIPASFDEVARNHTAKAIESAGIKNFHLLEEPLAAFHYWLSENRTSLNEHLKGGDCIVICDLGGGTCDFSLLSVKESSGELAIEREAVGPHLLLGGDNMDLALAFNIRTRLEQNGKAIDHWQFLSLVQQARRAKEVLLSEESGETFTFSIASRGSSLFKSSISCEITAAEVNELILEGFFPHVDSNAQPERNDAGLEDIGLPYEIDARITAHLAEFISNALPKGRKVTHLYFNGGVSRSTKICERITECISGWTGAPPVVLTNTQPDTAVSLGAAFHAALQEAGSKLRVRAGLSRSFYIAVRSAAPAVPGMPAQMHGLCIAKKGMLEGESAKLLEKKFQVRLGEEVRFELLEALHRDEDSIGSRVDHIGELRKIGSLSATLSAIDDAAAERIPVTLSTALGDLGLLTVTLESVDGEKSWSLDFDLSSEQG